MKLFVFLAVSALAIHSSTGTFRLAKNIAEKTVENTDAVVKKVLRIGSPPQNAYYDIRIHHKPACEKCEPSTSSANAAPARPSFPIKGRYFYYPTSYVYPSTPYYYYPSYVPAQAPAVSAYQKPSAQRRVGHAVYSQQPLNQVYYVYPSNVNTHKVVKPVAVHDYYNSDYQYQPVQFLPVASVANHGSVSPLTGHGLPPFSQIVRQKSNRRYVSPKNQGFGGFKGTSGSDAGIKGPTTTEAPIQQQQQEQQQEEEQTTDEPIQAVKGGFVY